MNYPTSPIRILYVEDVETDMELSIYEIRSESIPAVFLRVETKEEFIDQLEKYKPDIIITDYWLPDFDGNEVLKIAGKLAPQIPVIVVTGSVNEETAVECMKLGASDYLLKDKLKRLPFAIRDALELKQAQLLKLDAQAALAKSEQRFKEISELAQEFIWEIDQTGLYTYANRMCFDLSGYSVDELVGKKHFYDLIIPETKNKIKESVFEIINNKSNFLNFLCTILHKDGHPIILEITG
jgi:PAS domain S-box-containing protein